MRATFFFLLMLATFFLNSVGCDKAPAPAVAVALQASATDCNTAKNTCTDYSPYWVDACPAGERCIQFKNSCADPVALAYQIGCNGDGTKGAPQCDCTNGAVLPTGHSTYWQITDANYASCLPSWKPDCLTAGLAVLANKSTPSCTTGTRIEYSAGNSGDPYGKFDSYNLDIEKQWYQVPVSMKPDLTCAVDHTNHDCRPVYCDSDTCPDAYSTPTNGGCADGRSPQVGCQDTFTNSVGYVVEFCPSDCKTTGGACPSCEDAKACP